MDEQISGTTEAQINQTEVDPWAAAFAALEPKGEEADKATSAEGTVEDTQPDSGSAVSDNNETAYNSVPQGNAGGLDTVPGNADSEDGTAFEGMFGITEEDISKYEENVNSDIRNKAMREIAQEFIKRGVRNKNGTLGASLEDPDICKRDEDGVPHFFNPETKQEFRGDNPRRQAQEWIEDYNKEISRAYNNACAQYEEHLKKEAAPAIAVMKFAPKYEKLDDIRRGMFDNVIEDYEIKDSSGNTIGYSCDLDKALALVDKQIAMIQNYAKQHQQQQPQQQQNSGPVLDMKTSSGAVQSGDQTPPASLEEALLRVQERELAKMKR